MMDKEELIEVLREFEEKRIEELPENAKKLFYAIMSIADERDMLRNKLRNGREYILKYFIIEEDHFIKAHTFDNTNLKELYEILEDIDVK